MCVRVTILTKPGKEELKINMADKKLLIGAREHHHLDVCVVCLQSFDKIRKVGLEVEVEKIDGGKGVVYDNVEHAGGLGGLERAKGWISRGGGGEAKKRKTGELNKFANHC
jgi:hypothetical protein